jgi:hypothetical protein
MTSLTQLAQHTATPGRQGPRRSSHATAREARKRRGYDAVTASYVRELAATAARLNESRR